MDWREIACLMEVSIMFDTCTYCVFTLYIRLCTSDILPMSFWSTFGDTSKRFTLSNNIIQMYQLEQFLEFPSWWSPSSNDLSTLIKWLEDPCQMTWRPLSNYLNTLVKWLEHPCQMTWAPLSNDLKTLAKWLNDEWFNLKVMNLLKKCYFRYVSNIKFGLLRMGRGGRCC